MPSIVLEELNAPSDSPNRHSPATTGEIAKPICEADLRAAYEDGYQAGWEDSANAEDQNRTKINEELSRNLQELSFTFYEARSHVIRSMEPLIRTIVESLIPSTLGEAAVTCLIEQVQDQVETCSENPIRLMVSSSGYGLLERSIDCEKVSFVRILEEESLSDGQAYFKFGSMEHEIDLSGALEQVQSVMSAFFENNERSLKRA